MKEIALFGIRYYADGTQKMELIKSQKCTGDYKQGVDMCSSLPINEYDGFIFVDENEKFYRYNLQKPLRRKRNINYKKLKLTIQKGSEEIESQGSEEIESQGSEEIESHRRNTQKKRVEQTGRL